jgi:hypothetical protein
MSPKITAVHQRSDDIPVLIALLLKLRGAHMIEAGTDSYRFKRTAAGKKAASKQGAQTGP